MDKDKEITLHYIDKVHMSLIECGKSVNRNLIISIISSFALLGLVNGTLSIEDKVSALGADVKLESWLIMLSVISITTFSYIRVLAMSSYETRLRDCILRLYNELSFSDESMKDTESSPLEFPSIITTLTSKHNLNHNNISSNIVTIITLLVAFLPVFVVGYTYYQLYFLHSFEWWVLISSILVLSLTFIYSLSFFRSI